MRRIEVDCIGKTGEFLGMVMIGEHTVLWRGQPMKTFQEAWDAANSHLLNVPLGLAT